MAWDERFDARKHGAVLGDRRKVTLATGDLKAVLKRGDIDFAIVCVPTDDAAALTCRVLAAGIHVMAEKPVGLTPAEIRRVMAVARKARVQTSVLYGTRGLPAIPAARGVDKSGAIGPLISAEIRLMTTQVRFRDPKSWLFSRRRAGGGILTWLGCHFLDLLQYVSGDEIVWRFSAQLATRSGAKIDHVEEHRRAGRCDSAPGHDRRHLSSRLRPWPFPKPGGYLNSAGNDMYASFTGRRGRVVWGDRHSLHLEVPTSKRFARCGNKDLPRA